MNLILSNLLNLKKKISNLSKKKISNLPKKKNISKINNNVNKNVSLVTKINNNVNLVKKKYKHYVDKNVKVLINNEEKFNIHIVYFINCLNKNYFSWLTNQINMVKSFSKNIYIEATINKLDEETFKQKVLKLFPHVKINCYSDNEYEYRGILKVWELGQTFNNKNDILLYFHSKGITHTNNYNNVKNANYNIILKDINKIKEIFSIFPQIDKIGYCSGGIGWLWYNFWYARGSYISQVEKPLKTIRRHYYEDWLSRKINKNNTYNEINEKKLSSYKNTLNSCYGFHTNGINIKNIGSYYDPEDNKYIHHKI